jgi:hypothetical protein
MTILKEDASRRRSDTVRTLHFSLARNHRSAGGVRMSDQGVPNFFIVTPLTAQQTATVMAALERDREAVVSELGEFTTEVLPTGRILVLPQEEVPHVAYMSDDGPEARLVLDDYVPELGGNE